MKAIEQYFPVVLFITLYQVALTFEPVDKILSVTIQIKAIEVYFSVTLLITLYKVVQSFFQSFATNYLILSTITGFSSRRN